jgi:single-stranded DNA-binding protein
MSITALITGKLIADPEQRTGQSGKPYTRATVSAHDGDGDALVSVMAFGTVGEQLAAMAKGDTVALNGRAKLNSWTGRDGVTRTGLSLTADAMLTSYHLKRKRQAVSPKADPEPTQSNHDGFHDFEDRHTDLSEMDYR